MSLIDFSQDIQDHGCFHIMVTPLGNASGALYASVLNELQKFPPIQPSEPKGTVVFLKFLSYNALPKWAEDSKSKWKEFLAHKQILGVLGITQCQDIDDFYNIKAGFRESRERFKGTLCDYKCFVFVPEKEGFKEHIGTGGKEFCLISCNIDPEASTIKDVRVPVGKVEEGVTDLAESIYRVLNARKGEFIERYGGARSEQVKLLKTPSDCSDTSRGQDSDDIPGEPRYVVNL